MLVSDVLRALPFDQAAAWDPTGLQFGDPESVAKKVGVCHEVTERVVAESSGLDLLITYHPLLFRQQTRVIAGSGPGGRAYRLMRNGVSLAAIHTAWDAAEGGSADALAGALGLTNVVAVGTIERASAVGEGTIGRVGDFPGNLDELLDRIRKSLGSEPRVAGHPAKSNRVAVVPGSGGSFLAEAAASGASMFVTGDLSHHDMVEALDLGIVTIDVGHAASERPGVRALLEAVGKMVGDVIDLTYDPTPWHPTR